MKKLILIGCLVLGFTSGSIFASSEAICDIHMKSGEVENTYLCCKIDGKNTWLLNKKKCPGNQYSRNCGYETRLKSFKRGSVAEQCQQVIPPKMGFSDFRLVD